MQGDLLNCRMRSQYEREMSKDELLLKYFIYFRKEIHKHGLG